MMWGILSIAFGFLIFGGVCFLLKVILATEDQRQQIFCSHRWGDWADDNPYLQATDYFERLRLAGEGPRLTATCEKCGKTKTRQK